MIRQTLTAAVALGLLATHAVAESAGTQFTAPELGFIYDATAQNVRLISGVPGAASLDGPVDTGTTFTQAWVHSASKTAIGIAKSGEIAAAGWGGEAGVAEMLGSALGSLTVASFSSSGEFAAISDGTSVELYTGIGSEATLVATYGPGEVNALAVNDQGTVAVATTSQVIVYSGDDSRVAAMRSRGRRGGPAGRSETIAASGSGYGALVFLPNGDDLIAADNGLLLRIDDAATQPGRTVLSDMGAAPRTLAVSADGATVVAAVGQGVSLASATTVSEVVATDCGCEATGLEPLTGNAVFYLAGSESQQIYDADGATPRITTLINAATIELDGGIAQ